MIVDDIYQQFIDYFGEDRVDLKSYTEEHPPIVLDSFMEANIPRGSSFIFVYWPEVTITNEYDASVDIWDLYSCTIIKSDGKFLEGPLFIRSTYDKKQWDSDYLHSHVSSIRKTTVEKWHSSCLGSGPINNTIAKLRDNSTHYTDMEIWGLYCWELDKYVHVESINGVPYHRLSSIGASSGSSNTFTEIGITPNYSSDTLVRPIVKEFLKHILGKNVIRFSYYDGKFSIGIPYTEFVLLLSNEFIHFYNHTPGIKELYQKRIILNCNLIYKASIFNNTIFINSDGDNVPIETLIGTELFTFKDKIVKLNLKDFKQDYTDNSAYILNLKVVNYIAYLLLKYINVNYGKTSNSSNKKYRIV